MKIWWRFSNLGCTISNAMSCANSAAAFLPRNWTSPLPVCPASLPIPSATIPLPNAHHSGLCPFNWLCLPHQPPYPPATPSFSVPRTRPVYLLSSSTLPGTSYVPGLPPYKFSTGQSVAARFFPRATGPL
ncbi:hypothetical protein DFS34DRAFT_637643 [Phlyctochytrium arcticum]|nr:hypothetical protein DFS34DRAFT_640485 [Phlyctochytrium arcticum]KAI9090264.1 hypothetical protein DFS34DRAFT_637643 [Phlyctochytrium arcticum]